MEWKQCSCICGWIVFDPCIFFCSCVHLEAILRPPSLFVCRELAKSYIPYGDKCGGVDCCEGFNFCNIELRPDCSINNNTVKNYTTRHDSLPNGYDDHIIERGEGTKLLEVLRFCTVCASKDVYQKIVMNRIQYFPVSIRNFKRFFSIFSLVAAIDWYFCDCLEFSR